MNILLAEDNALCRMAYTEMLEACGAHVTAVRDGAEAVAACLTGEFDAALLDCYMDDMDGRAAAAKIRQMRPQMTLVLLTAEPEAATGDFDCVLPKPLRMEQVAKLLRR